MPSFSDIQEFTSLTPDTEENKKEIRKKTIQVTYNQKVALGDIASLSLDETQNDNKDAIAVVAYENGGGLKLDGSNDHPTLEVEPNKRYSIYNDPTKRPVDITVSIDCSKWKQYSGNYLSGRLSKSLPILISVERAWMVPLLKFTTKNVLSGHQVFLFEQYNGRINPGIPQGNTGAVMVTIMSDESSVLSSTTNPLCLYITFSYFVKTN